MYQSSMFLKTNIWHLAFALHLIECRSFVGQFTGKLILLEVD